MHINLHVALLDAGLGTIKPDKTKIALNHLKQARIETPVNFHKTRKIQIILCGNFYNKTVLDQFMKCR